MQSEGRFDKISAMSCLMKIKLKWFLILFCIPILSYGVLSIAKEDKGKRMVAYVGGANDFYKIDMEKYEVIDWVRYHRYIFSQLAISPDGKEVYATGYGFQKPLMMLDPIKLDITRELSEEGFEETAIDRLFDCEGKLSPDGSRYAIDCRNGLALIDTKRMKVIGGPKDFRNFPEYQAVFSNDSKILYAVSEVQIKKDKRVREDYIYVINAETGETLKKIKLPRWKELKLRCETDISDFIGEKVDMNLSCQKLHCSSCNLTLLKGDAIYPDFRADPYRIVLIKGNTGKPIDEFLLPEGRGGAGQLTLTPDGKRLFIGRGGYRDPGELTIMDVKSKKVIGRVMLDGGAESNVVFGYE